ncbi:hypothetical protein BB560_000348 [Smittium megazygosporum]|uniref:isopentenyl-diphosphate Delta-isomerase n=1 Tax=Smittium megazygosporum TaxID=133381 RepID=A0A2T9ZKL6_9FUNG|nr:hypothetical protein BB560_000348 [Smittium megazygosporum]
MAASTDFLNCYDKEQVRHMEETCILVDEQDNVVGADSKKNCHLITPEHNGKLHRAFSVFLFDSQNRLLLQQRAAEKITFPNYFTNTCCSHPLSVPSELEEADQIGAKRAAIRKLEHELGITPEQISVQNLKFLTRILYKAPSDNKWIEHELDYIFIVKADVNLKPNPNEVKSTRYVTPQELDLLFKTSESENILLTPWFKLIYNSFLKDWWNNLENTNSLSKDNKIHNMIN